jgi:hypothetical protein
MAKVTYAAVVDGHVVGQRKSDHAYTHAVVARQIRVSAYDGTGTVVRLDIEPRWVLVSCHADAGLASKATQAEYLTGDKKIRTFLREARENFSDIRVLPLEVR